MAVQLEFERFLLDKGLSPTKWLPLLELLDVDSAADLKSLTYVKYSKLITAARATDEEESILKEICCHPLEEADFELDGDQKEADILELQQRLDEAGFDTPCRWLPLLKELGVDSCQTLSKLDACKYAALEQFANHSDSTALKRLRGEDIELPEPSETALDISSSPVNIPTLETEEESKFDVLLKSLALYDFYPLGLKADEARVVRKERGVIALKKKRKLPFVILQKLMMLNTECRTSLTEVPREFKIPEDDTVHPMDGLLALIHCSDNFLRQIMFSKLATSQLAVPFLLPDPNKETVTFLLWAMRSIIKEWHCDGQSREGRIVECEAPIVSFLRCGKLENISKSEMINFVFFNKGDTFFHWNLVKGNPLRIAVDGLVDMSWYLHESEGSDNTMHRVSIANLHGDCSMNSKQWKFLAKCSFINVVLVNSITVVSHPNITMFKELSKAPGGLVLVSCEKNAELSNKLKGIKYTPISVYRRDKRKTNETIKDEFKRVFQKRSDIKFKSITDCVAIARDVDVQIDEETSPFSTQGRDLAKHIFTSINSEEKNKDSLLPLQGEKLWRQWAAENKSFHRLPVKTFLEIEKYKEEKTKKMEKIRDLQWEEITLMSSPVSMFYSDIISPDNRDSIPYYLYWVKLFLDDRSRRILQELYPKYCEKKNSKSKEDLQAIAKEMDAASIGMEHLMRELGQIFETVIEKKHEKKSTDPLASKLATHLPQIAADCLLSGHPFEIMDGDASHVPITWVKAVLDEVITRLHNPKVLVVSILGVQSTGKSTLLNTAFGLQFSVSAGRCTRGAFMQLLSLEKNDVDYQYILVIDSEGLRAPELTGELSNVHDNEIATFVMGIANVTIINLSGEAFAEMEDLLQTVVHALLRMKRVKKKSRVVFVHQNVSAVSARMKGDRGRLKFRELLDKMTRLAAKLERCENKYKSFNDVFKYNDEEDTFFFPCLWKGNPPMAPVNPGYIEKTLKLKSHILKIKSCQQLSFFMQHLCDVWNAILQEEFVFSFKNTLEVVAYTSLEKAFNQWHWKLQKEMLKWESNTKYSIETCDCKATSFKVVKKNQMSKADEAIMEWKSSIESDMKQFFEGEYKEILLHWKEKTYIRITELEREKSQEAGRFCTTQINYRLGREDLEGKQREHHNLILESVNELLKDLEIQGSQLNNDQLRHSFNENWTSWMQTTPYFHTFENETNVKLEIEECLRASSISRTQEITKRGGLVPLSDPALEVKHSHIEESTGVRLINTVGFLYQKANFQKVSDNILKNHIQILKKENNSFSKNLIDDILKSLLKAVEDSDVKFTQDYEVDLACTFCGYALHVFQALVEKVRKENDPTVYFEERKETYFSILETQYEKLAQSKQAAIVLCSLIRKSITSAVIDKIPQDVVDSMKKSSGIFNSKKALKVKILTDLAEKEDLKLFFKYLKGAKASMQNWIERYVCDHCEKIDPKNERKWIDSEILLLWKEFSNHIIEVAGSILSDSSKSVSLDGWLEDFQRRIEGYIPLSLQDMISHTRNFKITEDSMNDFVCELVDCIKKVDCDVKKVADSNSWKFKVIEIFSEVIGCCEQCPFCAEQCDLQFPDHVENDKVKHSVQMHRPECLAKYQWKETEELVFDICSTCVATKQFCFKNKDTGGNFHYYQDYKTIYPKWEIIPEHSITASSYWKWFVSKYSSEITKRNGAKETSIPDGWKKLSKEQVLSDLKRVY